MKCEQEILFDRSILSRKFSSAEQAMFSLKALDINEAELRYVRPGHALSKSSRSIRMKQS